MAKYLIDANLPYYFSIWSSKDYLHVFDLNDEWSDEEIWEYAKANNLTIITKDSDFSDKILFADPPPRVIHVKISNMKMKEFHQFISSIWDEACNLSGVYKIIRIFRDRIEGIN